MCLIHRWTKWERYIERGTVILGRVAPKNMQGKEIKYEELRQHRTCEKCGKMQDEAVK